MRIIGFPDDGRFIAVFRKVAVKAIFSDVQFGSFEPFDTGLRKVPAQYVVPFLSPLKVIGNTLPELFRIVSSLGPSMHSY